MSISTQWRVGPGGPIGLDYNVLFARMARMGLHDEPYENLFQDLRAIEREALTLMHKT